jgi:leader peptidase (prepilin peptidase)/N-methyltransferase
MNGVDLIFVGLLVAVLAPMTIIDLQEQRIPNLLNLALAGLGLLHGFIGHPGVATLGLALVQAGLTFALFAGTTRIMRVLSPRAFVGWGDLKFLVAISCWVGLNGSIIVLLIACIVHIGLVLAMAPWAGLVRNQLRPFGPMLAAGALVVVVLNLWQGRGV